MRKVTHIHIQFLGRWERTKWNHWILYWRKGDVWSLWKWICLCTAYAGTTWLKELYETPPCPHVHHIMSARINWPKSGPVLWDACPNFRTECPLAVALRWTGGVTLRYGAMKVQSVTGHETWITFTCCVSPPSLPSFLSLSLSLFLSFSLFSLFLVTCDFNHPSSKSWVRKTTWQQLQQSPWPGASTHRYSMPSHLRSPSWINLLDSWSAQKKYPIHSSLWASSSSAQLNGWSLLSSCLQS